MGTDGALIDPQNVRPQRFREGGFYGVGFKGKYKAEYVLVFDWFLPYVP